jgi:uncharacterized protein YbcV (DUF1398 family)
MFTLNDITAAHAKVKSGADFPAYVQDLITLGLSGYDHNVTDGSTTYKGQDGYTLNSDARYAPLQIAATGNAELLTAHLRAHQGGETDYPTFCRQAAEAGVEKWELNFGSMTCCYRDTAGTALLTEHIPAP